MQHLLALLQSRFFSAFLRLCLHASLILFINKFAVLIVVLPWLRHMDELREGARIERDMRHMKYENLLRIRRVGRRDVNCLSNCEYCVFYVCACVYCVYVVCVCIFFVFVCFSFGQFSHAATKFDWALDCDL